MQISCCAAQFAAEQTAAAASVALGAGHAAKLLGKTAGVAGSILGGVGTAWELGKLARLAATGAEKEELLAQGGAEHG